MKVTYLAKIFPSYIIEIERLKEKSLEVFKGDNEKNTPFRKDRLPYQKRQQGGGRYYYMTKSSNRDQSKNVRFQNNARASARKFHHVGSVLNGKYLFYSSMGSSYHQQLRTGSSNKDCSSRACASSNKKIIYKKHSKCTISRNTRLLHSSLGKHYSGSKNFIYCKGAQNPVCKSPISGENTKLDKNVKRTIFISGKREMLKMLEKDSIQKVVPKQGRFLSNIFLVVKKDGGNFTVINLKNLYKFIPYENFKMEVLCCLKFLLQQDDFVCKIDLNEAYYLASLNKNSQRFVRFQ